MLARYPERAISLWRNCRASLRFSTTIHGDLPCQRCWAQQEGIRSLRLVFA
jgi:hypothetical protein